jgi:fungalysin metallopeptidase (M36)/PKD domain-containing protein
MAAQATVSGVLVPLVDASDNLSLPLAVRAISLIAVGVVGSWLWTSDPAAPAVDRNAAYFDIRTSIHADIRPTLAQRDAMNALSGVRIRWDGRYGAPAVVVRYGGYLSGPGTDARDYLRSNAALLGLTDQEIDQLVPVLDYRSGHNGTRHVAFQQTDGDRVVHGSLIKVTLDRLGRVTIMGGTSFPRAAAADRPALSEQQAIAAAADMSGARTSGSTTAQLVTFPMPGGRPSALGWRTLLQTGAGWLDVIVDARNGRLLYRTDHRSFSGPQGTVFTVQHPDLGSRQVLSFAGAPFNNAGWVTDRSTAGNNANAYQDLNNDDVADYQPQTPPLGDPAYQHFDFPFTDAFRTALPLGTDVTTDRDAAVTQAFYRINFLHDYFYALGFDEPAGNFQDDNFGRGGIGGDGMLVEIDNGINGGPSETSNTQTLPGQRPRMEITANPDTLTDGAFDADHLTHEYTHGVSNRLIMTEVVGGGLPFGNQTWALGEGWSEFYATSITNDPIAGEYVCGSPTGCPLYAFDNSPLVYSQLCTLDNGDCEPHLDGEIWTAALWDLRAALGKAASEQLVIDGIKSTTPTTATFLDARDGILAADVATNGGANQCLIWRIFARREMGVSASTVVGDEKVKDVAIPATDVPPSCIPTANAGGPYTTTEGVNVSLNGTGSTAGSDSSAGTIATYAWDLDNDGEYDDATGATPMFTAVGQDGTFTVRLRITSSVGISDTASSTVTVTNVAPTVSLAAIAASVEGATVTLSGTGSDAGWLDALTATVDWDDGNGPQPLTGSTENVFPNATLTFSSPHVYGDNGTFVINVCVSDDDTTTCKTVSAAVANVIPTAVISPSGQTSYDGTSAYVTHAGDLITVEAQSADPGSDDLTLTWDWDDGPDTVVVSLVNPPLTDPAKSPSVQPRNVTLSRSHTYDDACVYNLTFRSRDDDGGTATDDAVVVIVGNATVMRGSGWWLAQYRPGPPDDFSAKTLSCYLEIAVQLSIVFDAPLTRADAVNILFVNRNRGTAQQLFDEQLLAAWLNFANGAIGFADPVDTNGDGLNDTTFGAALFIAETVRKNPASTREQLLQQKNILERIVLRDES